MRACCGRSTASRSRVAARRHRGAGRRIGLGQVGVSPGDHGHPAAHRADHSGAILFADPATGAVGRHRQLDRPAARDAGDPRRPHLDHLPGADDLAVAAPHDRRPDRRGAGCTAADRGQRRASDHRDAAPGRLPRPQARAAHLPLRAVGRPAPARDDRHGAGLPPGAADRRRADHRARRHHPGADPEADRRTCRPSSAWRCCSSPTISAWSPTSPTRSSSCTAAR